MTQHKIYKHKYVITVLSEQEYPSYSGQYNLEGIQYNITQGPDLGGLSLESITEITDRAQIERECIALGSDGEFFTGFWDEDELDEREGGE